MTGPQEQASYITQSVHIGGAGWDVRCCTYPDAAPILAITAGHSRADISTAERLEISAGMALFARGLANRRAAVRG